MELSELGALEMAMAVLGAKPDVGDKGELVWTDSN
jgi:hypothetical protein